jgi:hypothetical protein
LSNFLNNTTDLEKILNTLNNGKYVDTADATATANDIANGKTAYVNGENIEGTYTAPTLADLTADADATAGDIASGKTAYVDGVKVMGTKTSIEVLGEVVPSNSSYSMTVVTADIPTGFTHVEITDVWGNVSYVYNPNTVNFATYVPAISTDLYTTHYIAVGGSLNMATGGTSGVYFTKKRGTSNDSSAKLSNYIKSIKWVKM